MKALKYIGITLMNFILSGGLTWLIVRYFIKPNLDRTTPYIIVWISYIIVFLVVAAILGTVLYSLIM